MKNMKRSEGMTNEAFKALRLNVWIINAADAMISTDFVNYRLR